MSKYTPGRNLFPNGDFSKTRTSTTELGITPNCFPVTWNAFNIGASNINTSYQAYVDADTFNFNTICFNGEGETTNIRMLSLDSTVSPDVFNSISSTHEGSFYLSVDVYATGNTQISGGLYYYQADTDTRDFISGKWAHTFSVFNEWKRLVIKVPYNFDANPDRAIAFYIYGHGVKDGVKVWLKNIKLEWAPNDDDLTNVGIWSIAPEDTTSVHDSISTDNITI